MSNRAAASSLSSVLLAIDGSEYGDGAVRIATSLAVASGASLTVLDVLPPNGNGGLMGLDTRAAAANEGRTAVERVALDIRRAGGQAEAITRQGASPSEAIVETAKETGADMIIMGRRGRRGLVWAMFDNAATRAIGSSNCPVLVVPRNAVPWTERILLATDGSPASEIAALRVAQCAERKHIPITVLSVEVPAHAPERKAETAKIVERTVAALRAQGLDATGLVGRGAPPDEIMRVATETKADLIAIGSEGRGGLGRMMLGSNSQAVISRTTCAVLVTTARMSEAPTAKPAPETAVAPSLDEKPAKRTFLIVADGSDEMIDALDYACRRASATDGQVAMLHVSSRPHSDTDRETTQAAQTLLEQLASRVERNLGHRPSIYRRSGQPSRALLDLVDEERGISVIVLAASSDPHGAGPLISDLVLNHAARLPIPVVIVPGGRGRV